MESYKKMLKNAGYEVVGTDVINNVFTCTRDGRTHLFRLDNEGNIEGHKILLKEENGVQTYFDVFNKRLTTFNTNDFTLVATTIDENNIKREEGSTKGENKGDIDEGIGQLITTLEELGML